MANEKVLVANRGEVAVRILRALSDLGMRSVSVHSADDVHASHVRLADESVRLDGRGAKPYLDAEQLVAAATNTGCQAVHPGYGFVSESALFAEGCVSAGLVFVGPEPAHLRLFGDKVAARQMAEKHGIAVPRGTVGPSSLAEIQSFFEQLGPRAGVMIKAVVGGGGRGMRQVNSASELESAYNRCASEAYAAFGSSELYAEELVAMARHIEVQVIGDGLGDVSHIGDRECSLQRRHQKLVEVAPAPSLSPQIRDELCAAAVRMAGGIKYRSLGTFEFLVRQAEQQVDLWRFIEVNPRLQVEHTVTEEVTSIDLVQTQIRIAFGESLESLGLQQAEIPAPRGFAVEARVNMETMKIDGSATPEEGTLQVFMPPSGPGVRTDTFAYPGYKTSVAFDSLLAKVIVHSPDSDYPGAVRRARRALDDTFISGVSTNLEFLRALLRDPDVEQNRVSIEFIDEHVADLVAVSETLSPSFESLAVDVVDRGSGSKAAPNVGPAGSKVLTSDRPGVVVEIAVVHGAVVAVGDEILVLEAMKMEHVVLAAEAGVIQRVEVDVGATVTAGDALVYFEALPDSEVVEIGKQPAKPRDLRAVRPDLSEVIERHQIGLDEGRPRAVERRRRAGKRTARENIADLVDEDSFVEYGPLVIAAQRQRRSLADLIENTPADGMIGGLGRVNGDVFEDEVARCAVMAYDYTVHAGTQGAQNHRKKDRLFQLAKDLRVPLVCFVEGGGGRPGDTDGLDRLDLMTFHHFSSLSGLVPLVGIVSGRCFAGNAVLAGCCDVIIATKDINLGMAGPAMIEGGGLGQFRPEDIGPIRDQAPNGVVDIVAEDEEAAVAAAKKYLSYFQGSLASWACVDQRNLRHLVPENRLRSYDMRSVIDTMADVESVLELRREFAPGMITCLGRIEGRPLGIIANNPLFLGGAIDSNCADKAARFMQLCDAFDLPILMLCDTPGMMVGPVVERSALVRHCSRLFVNSGNLSTPLFTIVTRKGYGLGAQAMAGGSFRAGGFTVAWPTGEFGGMGLEGAVQLGYRKDLDAIQDPQEQRELYDKLLAASYAEGRALNSASLYEIDDVIDPIDSRRWVISALRSQPSAIPRKGKKRPCVDSW